MEIVWWSAVAAVIVALLLVDLLMFSRGSHEVSLGEATAWSVVWLAAGLGFALVVWGLKDAHDAAAYVAGYLIERTLAVDNIVVFAVVLAYFAVPAASQARVLFFGVVGALVLRAAFIAAGAAALGAFHWMEYAFGAFLVVTAYRLYRARGDRARPEDNAVLRRLRGLVPSTARYDGARVLVREEGRLRATPIAVVLVAVAAVDVAFAVDSIPAIFAVTRDPFLVFTSNAFAVLGLRALYFVLVGMMDRFVHLKTGLAMILAFVGLKMLLADFYELPVWLSLAVILAVLAASIAASIRREHEPRRWFRRTRPANGAVKRPRPVT